MSRAHINLKTKRPSPVSVGDVFGRWTVKRKAPTRYGTQSYWHCFCACGTEKEVAAQHLYGGKSTSCGCFNRERPSRIKHGRTKTAEHSIWIAMKQRCSNPNCKAYRNYGARGITVSAEWVRSFDKFLADMGPRPSKAHSIDRINNDGNYEAGNCRWALMAEQRANSRRTRNLTYNGETMPMRAWAKRLGIPETTFAARIRSGMSVADAGNIREH